MNFHVAKTKGNNCLVLLRHVEEGFVVIQPKIMIRYRHLVERDFLRVLEEAVRPPDIVQPVYVQYSVLLGHVLR